MLSLPIVFGALTASALVVGLVALWWSVRSTLAGAEEAALDLGEDSSERTALLESKRSLLRALKDLEHERQVGKLDEADYQRLSATYRARAKEVLAQLDQDLGPYLDRARALTGATEVAGRPYLAVANKKKAKADPARSEATDEAAEEHAEASDEAANDEAASDEGGEAQPSRAEAGSSETSEPKKSADAVLASLPEDKRKEAEAFLAKLAAEAKTAADEEDEA